MIDGLLDFIVMIKDFILSLINGLAILIQSLTFVLGINVSAGVWMPTLMVNIMGCSLILIIVLRIVGR